MRLGLSWLLRPALCRHIMNPRPCLDRRARHNTQRTHAHTPNTHHRRRRRPRRTRSSARRRRCLLTSMLWRRSCMTARTSWTSSLRSASTLTPSCALSTQTCSRSATPTRSSPRRRPPSRPRSVRLLCMALLMHALCVESCASCRFGRLCLVRRVVCTLSFRASASLHAVPVLLALYYRMRTYI